MDIPDVTSEALYEKGAALMKQSDLGGALTCFRQSAMLHPNGKAAEMVTMLEGIMEFYCKDLYNP